MDVALAAKLTVCEWKRNYEDGVVGLPEARRNVDGEGMAHARWMLETIMQEATTWKNDKLNRWLGYAQALLVSSQVLSLWRR